ncbi:hypothetical protein M405DRAFT_815094 [Rhizopogon salebrosus TDB-379]|nr:hypothetical protein M405DRAFT_815094 [Rhizopogon salebrosus TDB-379]
MSSRAPLPFDHPQADIILRSSDGTDFRVFKMFLKFSCPFFKMMFELPQPAVVTGDDTKNCLPIIVMQDDSKIVDIFLRFCYPCTLAKDPPS